MPENSHTGEPITTGIYTERQRRLRISLSNAGFRGVALNPGPTLTYLTGLHFHLMERPVLFIVPVDGDPVLVLPELELAKTTNLSFLAKILPYGEQPSTWPHVFQDAALAADLADQYGVEPTRMRYLELHILQAAAPTTRFLSAEESLAQLRMFKDPGEIACMRQAVIIAQQALVSTLPFIRHGITERELAAELTLQLLRQGSDAEMPFTPIVAAGPNSANPHASPTDRQLAPGDLLVIDWGAGYQGYISDLTRTFAIGKVEPELERIVALVEAANAAGRAAAKPGQTAGAVDQAAREVIEKGGYGKYFTHRTGHGIGMEGHEPPYIRGDNEQLLQPGMTFTVEPGIYLTGRNGSRIEDDILITEDGSQSLSDLPRQLHQLEL
jgi:Xaa-Pro dipeptidase